MTKKKESGSRRGFAGMDPKKQKEISSKGGKVAHALGRAHEFTSEEAREAGRTGGAKVSADSAHMAEIGRRGALSRAAGAKGARSSDSGEKEADVL